MIATCIVAHNQETQSKLLILPKSFYYPVIREIKQQSQDSKRMTKFVNHLINNHSLTFFLRLTLFLNGFFRLAFKTYSNHSTITGKKEPSFTSITYTEGDMVFNPQQDSINISNDITSKKGDTNELEGNHSS